MGAVDPKDMTAGELLRWAANEEFDEYGHNNVHSKLLSALDGKSFVDTTTSEDMESIRNLADKIDAELAQARELSLLHGAAIWAKANGWPGFREGEGFGEWVNRCWLPIPRYEDGEPVDESDFGEGACLMVFGNGDWKIGNRYGGVIEMGSCRMRAQRPAAPDTQERICADALKSITRYWGCEEHPGCERCPARIDGKTPRDRFDTNSCGQAQMLDLLRRQRELDKRTGGE